jgi:hypothetical protein
MKRFISLALVVLAALVAALAGGGCTVESGDGDQPAVLAEKTQGLVDVMLYELNGDAAPKVRTIKMTKRVQAAIAGLDRAEAHGDRESIAKAKVEHAAADVEQRAMLTKIATSELNTTEQAVLSYYASCSAPYVLRLYDGENFTGSFACIYGNGSMNLSSTWIYGDIESIYNANSATTYCTFTGAPMPWFPYNSYFYSYYTCCGWPYYNDNTSWDLQAAVTVNCHQ